MERERERESVWLHDPISFFVYSIVNASKCNPDGANAVSLPPLVLPGIQSTVFRSLFSPSAILMWEIVRE